MSILADLELLESSTIYKLVYNGAVLGLRVKIFSITHKKFFYYDFETSYVKRPDLCKYLNSHINEFSSVPLIDYNNVVCSQEEIDGSIVVQEFKSNNDAEGVLDKVISIIENSKEG